MAVMTRSPLLRLLLAVLLIVAFVGVADAYARRWDCHVGEPQCPGGCDIYAWGCDWCQEDMFQCGIWIRGQCDEIFCQEPCVLGDCVEIEM